MSDRDLFESDNLLFPAPLYVGKPNIGNRERFMQRVERLLDTRWLSNNGPMVVEFEEKLAEYCGVDHCIAICNATIAMELAARALELKGEVIVPAYTFVATAHALRWQEIEPVFADMDARTHNLNPQELSKLITPRTTAIVGTHVWGRPCAIEAISAIAEENSLKIIYDAAHAFGCSYKGKMLGGNGDCEIFSFHATKFLNSFEGGAIATNDGALAGKLRLMRNFGFQGFDNVVHLGTNGKMSEIHAAMGLTCLEDIERFVRINHSNYLSYAKYLSGIPGVSLIEYDSGEKNNFQYIVIEVDSESFRATRDALVDFLVSKNIIARKYFWPGVHRMQPYSTEQPDASSCLQITQLVAANVVVLPTGETIDDETIRKICNAIRQFAERMAS
jgi:dTDP-4-amino-4,6-dideoxygalactose transaminase